MRSGNAQIVYWPAFSYHKTSEPSLATLIEFHKKIKINAVSHCYFLQTIHKYILHKDKILALCIFCQSLLNVRNYGNKIKVKNISIYLLCYHFIYMQNIWAHYYRYSPYHIDQLIRYWYFAIKTSEIFTTTSDRKCSPCWI